MLNKILVILDFILFIILHNDLIVMIMNRTPSLTANIISSTYVQYFG